MPGPAGQEAEGGPGGRGRPPRRSRSPPAGPEGTEGPFVRPPPRPHVPPREGERDTGGAERAGRPRAEGRGRREGGGRASSAAGPGEREAPKGETRVPREALSAAAVKNQRANLGPGEKNNRGDLVPLTGPAGLGASFSPEKVNSAGEGSGEGRGGRRAARRERASLPSQCHRCLSWSGWWPPRCRYLAGRQGD